MRIICYGKGKRKLISVVATILILIFLVVIFAIKPTWNSKQGMLSDGGSILFSVDDATEIFLEIFYQDPDSIFANERMEKLKIFHDEYDMDVILYVYEEYNGFNLAQFPTKYINEFKENADWLRIGFHGINECNPIENGFEDEAIFQSFLRVNSDISLWAGESSIADTLRLHYWYGTSGLINDLASVDVKRILYIDREDQLGYDFSRKDDNAIRTSVNGILTKYYSNGPIDFLLTDIRLENTEDVSNILNMSDNCIVVFTHAWCLNDNFEKLDAVCRWAREYNYSMNYF